MMRALADNIHYPEAQINPEIVTASVAVPEVEASVAKLNPAAKEFVPTAIPTIIVTQHSPEPTPAKATEAVISAKFEPYMDEMGNDIVEIDAHRKALQDALFDNCGKESLRKMLNRCKAMPTASAEFYPKEVDEKFSIMDENVERQVPEFAPTRKCLTRTTLRSPPSSVIWLPRMWKPRLRALPSLPNCPSRSLG
jgi:hypothetical protein